MVVFSGCRWVLVCFVVIYVDDFLVVGCFGVINIKVLAIVVCNVCLVIIVVFVVFLKFIVYKLNFIFIGNFVVVFIKNFNDEMVEIFIFGGW